MGTRPKRDYVWGAEKVFGMVRAGRWSDEEIARYVGTHSVPEIARIRRDLAKPDRSPHVTAYMPPDRGLGLEEERQRRAANENSDDLFLNRLREVFG